MSFEELGNAFWQWLEKNGATLSDGIKLHDYRDSEGAGRGVIATRDLKVNIFVFCIFFFFFFWFPSYFSYTNSVVIIYGHRKSKKESL